MAAIRTREKVLEVLRRMPEDATLDEIIERLCFVAKVERGLAEADKEQTIPHEEVKRGFARG